MNKSEIERRLRAMANEVACMSDYEVEQLVKNERFEMNFVHFCWGEPAKINVSLAMYKESLG